MAKKFTFKYDAAETGLSAVGNSLRGSKIKINKKVCGHIKAPNWRTPDNLYRVQFAVVCPEREFKWITLKYKNADEKALKAWLNEKFDAIVAKYELHTFEDY